MDEPPVTFGAVSVIDGGRVVLDRLSLTMPRGSVYAVIGREDESRTAIIDCLLGNVKPTSGEVRLFGDDPRKQRRRWLARVTVVSADRTGATLADAISRSPELLVLPKVGGAGAILKLGEALAAMPTPVFMTANSTAGVESVASRVGILKSGRIRFEQDIGMLPSQVRKITYRNEITETRADYGSELDEFEAVRVRVRGWGIEAIVREFTTEKFDRLRNREGVVEVSAAPVSLDELFVAVAGPVAATPAM
jgi:ABC-type multidrug transport system ATPase subunit